MIATTLLAALSMAWNPMTHGGGASHPSESPRDDSAVRSSVQGGEPRSTQPRELGAVPFERSFRAAQERSRAERKPMFVLFDEVPGCATCVSFGESVLSHPLLADVVKSVFVPIAIYNNVPEEADLLKRFEEPSWNNPVVRFLDGDGRELIPRKDGIYTIHETAARMASALTAAKRPVPELLELIVEESSPARLSKATFTMHCFWEGEGALGSLRGVRATRAGWLEGAEAVEVTYDPQRISYETLTEKAKSFSCFVKSSKNAPTDAKESDRKHALAQSRLSVLPLTSLQQVRVNAALQSGKDPSPFLTERQRHLARLLHSSQSQLPADLAPPESVEGWESYLGRLEQLLKG